MTTKQQKFLMLNKKKAKQFNMSITTPTPSKTVPISILSSGDATIYWGDGSSELVSQNPVSYAMTHVYASAGTHDIIIDKPQRVLKLEVILSATTTSNVSEGELRKLKKLESVIFVNGNNINIGSGDISSLRYLKKIRFQNPYGANYPITIEEGELALLSDLEYVLIHKCPNVHIGVGDIENLSNLDTLHLANVGTVDFLPSEISGKPSLYYFLIYGCGTTSGRIDDFVDVIYSDRMIYTNDYPYFDFEDIGYSDPPHNAYASAHAIEVLEILKNDPLEEGFNKWDYYVNIE